MELVNRTPFSAARTVVSDRQGHDVLLTVVKCTYAVGKGALLEPAERQLPMQAADDFYGKPGESSVRWESDFAVYKPATDVVVLGHAYPPRRPEPELQVALRLGPLFRVLTVFGDRHWRTGLGMSSPEPFTKMGLPRFRGHWGYAANLAGRVDRSYSTGLM